MIDRTWGIVEARNLFVEEGTDAVIYVIDRGITWLEEAGVEA